MFIFNSRYYKISFILIYIEIVDTILTPNDILMII